VAAAASRQRRSTAPWRRGRPASATAAACKWRWGRYWRGAVRGGL